MKKISIMILVLVVALASCKKTPEVNLKYVDVERDLITVGITTATVQCDYQYIATLKKAYLCYGEGENEDNFSSAEMRVVQNTLYVDLAGLTANTTYNYYYEFHNGFNSMRTVAKTFKTEGGSGPAINLPTVVTGEVTEITSSSAKGSGEVTNNGGAEVTERGICWSTNENPTLNDSYVAAGTGTGAFTAMMNGLEVGTSYHVRAYATNEVGTAYGLDREFVTDNGGECDCGYVDLGLASGTLWATCNLGANSPEESGDLFAWGETEPKSQYDWSTYKFCKGSENTLTKYCSVADYGYNGFVDNLPILWSEDDAATINLGVEWRIPSPEEWEELCRETTSTLITQNGVYGRLFTASNGNSIFLPSDAYWANKHYPVNPDRAYCIIYDNSWFSASSRSDGHSIRPVRKWETPTPPSGAPIGAISGLFTINENEDKVYFSKGNLQYIGSATMPYWKFADNQWDYFGENQNGDSQYIDRDLFGWGASGYNHGAVCYQPWSISETNSDYYAYGNSSYQLNDQTGQADWGYNAIENGGNTENIWRTLTNREWWFVFEARSSSSGIKYAKAKVDGINGVILLPDDWSSNTYSLNNTNSSDVDYSSNIISESVWVDAFESKGAVFLPAAGRRSGSTVNRVGQYGYYWSATYASSEDGCCVYFYDSSLSYSLGDSRYCGRCVRLVNDANP